MLVPGRELALVERPLVSEDGPVDVVVKEDRAIVIAFNAELVERLAINLTVELAQDVLGLDHWLVIWPSIHIVRPLLAFLLDVPELRLLDALAVLSKVNRHRDQPRELVQVFVQAAP